MKKGWILNLQELSAQVVEHAKEYVLRMRYKWLSMGPAFTNPILMPTNVTNAIYAIAAVQNIKKKKIQKIMVQ